MNRQIYTGCEPSNSGSFFHFFSFFLSLCEMECICMTDKQEERVEKLNPESCVKIFNKRLEGGGVTI